MNRLSHIILAAIAVILSTAAYAQTDVSLDPEFGGRLSIGIDKKIKKGLHVTLEEEIRMKDNFGSLGRLQTTIGVKYKVLPYLRLGVGYIMINPYDSDSSQFSDIRHRFFFDATGTLRFGDWAFSLKERLQATHRTGYFNEYQNPATALTLKSRAMAKYKGFGKFEPYAYFEIRHFLNAPVIIANYDGTNYLTPEGNKKGEPGWFLEGFDGCYANRYRTALGVDVNINRQNTLGIFFLADYISDKKVDANAEGTKLKSYTKQTGFVGHIGLEYVFSF
ncbi:MAG: DUF2490 domain-containing protein [Bacteroidales bacterium]|nr:DUF2490 domain-containing protein [Bacteroidales bacterium]